MTLFIYPMENDLCIKYKAFYSLQYWKESFNVQ